MRALHVLLLCCLFAVASSLPAAAAPKTSSTGAKCDESASNVKHQIKGKDYTCDKCVYSKCDTAGGSISNCQRVTEYTNCVAAARTGPAGTAIDRTKVDTLAPATGTPPKRGPVIKRPPNVKAQ